MSYTPQLFGGSVPIFTRQQQSFIDDRAYDGRWQALAQQNAKKQRRP
jgi:hypothetical protein